MASLFNTKISNSYVGLIKTVDNAVINSSLRELTDGSGNGSGIHLNNAGDLKVTNILEWGTLKDTGENISITKFVDEADGIASNDNDTSIPTSGAVVDYVASRITLEDLDFSGDSGTGSVDLDSQVFAVVGTANEIETSGGSQQLQIGLPTNIVIAGTTTFGGNLIGNSNIILKDNSARTLAAFYAGGKGEIYFNDSKKFETTSDGATVTGGLTATGGSVFTGATFSSDVTITGVLSITGDGSNAATFTESGSGDFTIASVDDMRLDAGGGDIVLKTGGNEYGRLSNSSQDFVIKNITADKDIIFQADDGSGGTTEYFKLDGVNTINVFSKETFMLDNIKLRFGTGGDLNIYHDTSNSYIKDTGTGSLFIDGANYVQIRSATDSAVMANFAAGGAAILYHAGSSKITTTATGATVTGTVTSDGLALGDNDSITMGDAGDFSLKHDGSNSKIENNTGHFNIIQEADNSDITFFLDDGSGGSTEYIKLDGGNEEIYFYKNTVHLDSVKSYWGNAGDLEIYHDASNSYISDTGTGILNIKSSTSIKLRTSANEDYLVATEGAGVELYYDNVKKFETSSTGANITGNLVMGAGQVKFADGGSIFMGDSNDLQIIHDSSNATIDNNTGDLIIRCDGDDIKILAEDDVVIRDNDDATEMAKFINGAAVELYYNGSKKFETSNTGVSVTGSVVASGEGTFATNLTVTRAAGSTDDSLKITSADIVTTIERLENSGDASAGYGRIDFKTNADAGHANAGRGGFKFIDGSNNSILYLDNKDSLATFGGAVTIAGDLTVNGTTTTVNTDHFNVEDPLISMAKDNAANTVDIGFYGKYTESATAKYLGLFSDASDSNKFKLFKGLQTEPTTTVDVTATGYTLADLDAGAATFGGILKLSYANPVFDLQQSGTTKFRVELDGADDTYMTGYGTGNKIFIRTDSTTAITIDGSQNTTFTGNVSLADSKYAYFGNANDFYIGHTGTSTVLLNSTGHLEIANYSDDKSIYFKTDDGSGGVTTYIKIDGLQNYTEFPVAARFMDSVQLQFGDSNDSDIYHNGNDMLFRNHKAAGDMSFNADSTGSGGSATSYFWLDGGVVKTRFAKDANFEDNVKLTFGNVTTPDLEIYHDTSNSYIREIGTGNLYIQASERIRFTGINNEALLYLNENSNVEIYYDNSKKFETTSAGATITGALSITGDGSNAATLTETGAGLLTIATVDDFVVDAGGDITLDTGGNDIRFFKAGVEFGKFKNDSGNFAIYSSITDEDMIFRGDDGGSLIDALTLDMSNGGSATFRDDIDFGGKLTQTGTGANTFNGDVLIPRYLYHSGDTNTGLDFQTDRVTMIAGGVEFVDFNNTAQDYITLGSAGDCDTKLQGGSGFIFIQGSDGYMGFNDLTPTAPFDFAGNANFAGTVTSTAAGNGNAPILHITDTADTEVAWFEGNRAGDTGAYIAIQHLPSTAAETNRSGIKFQAKDDGDNVTTYASLIQYISDYTGGTEDGIFTVNTMTNGSVTEKMKFLPQGEIVIGQGSSNAGFLDFDGTNLQFNTQRNPNTGSFVDSNKSHAHIGLQGSDGGSKIVFATASANNTTASTRMTVMANGSVGIGTSVVYAFGSGTATGFFAQPNGYFGNSVGTGVTAVGICKRQDDGTQMRFYQGTSTVGEITTTSTATAYNTGSDYRLKEDLKDFNGLDKVSKISVYDFKWKSDDSRSYGVMAHELEEVLPQAVVGEKDAEEMQGVDYSKIVPLLVKSIQELKAEVDSLKQKCKCKN